MRSPLPSPLPLFDRNLLRAVERIVPAAERDDWCRSWQSELWHVRHRTPSRRSPATLVLVDLSIGLLCDAIWLRTDSWRRSLNGTAVFCLAALAGLCLLSTLSGLAITGSWPTLTAAFSAPFQRFLVEAPLLVAVNFAISSRRFFLQRSTSQKSSWFRRQVFFVAQTSLLLLLTVLLSADLCQPLHAHTPTTSDLLQSFLFVFSTLIGLRWAFADQEQRCKHCLRSLANPARVGRPSHNFLEWSGTELVCKHGHGLLSVPEMESSWCESSRWLDQASTA